jgi:hypothetical protein
MSNVKSKDPNVELALVDEERVPYVALQDDVFEAPSLPVYAQQVLFDVCSDLLLIIEHPDAESAIRGFPGFEDPEVF